MENAPNKINVGFITYALRGGGAEKTIIGIVKYLNNQPRFRADILMFKKIIDYKNTAKGINTMSILKTNEKIPFFLLPIRAGELLIRLIFVIKREKYNVLVGGWETVPYYTSVLLGLLLRKKTVLIVGNNLSKELEAKSWLPRNIHHLLLKISFFFCTKIVGVSRGVIYDLVKHFAVPKNKISLIYNGIDLAKIKRESNEKTELPGFIKNNYIVSCGRLVERKGHDYLIRAFNIVNKLLPNTKLVIVGQGSLKKYLLTLIKELGLEKKVFIIKFIENPFPYFKYAKLFVFPSFFEGLGNVMLEAMACGLPVISFDCPYGPREVLSVNDNNYPLPQISKNVYARFGVLTPVGNYKELAKAIAFLMQNKQTYTKYKNAGLKRVIEFDSYQMNGSYRELFIGLIGKEAKILFPGIVNF